MSNVTGSLLKALDKRKAAAAAPGSNLPWTTGKISWLKFTSNVLQNGDESPFQSIGGDNLEANNLYDKGSRSVPTPGVVSATIKHTGTLKTLKKTEVSYKCWSISHLVEMEKLFMSLGKTVVLEYGWSKKPDGTPVSSILTDEQFGLAFADFIIETDKLAKINQGSYGAEKGVVSNFSWTANDDGSYDCSTSFISPSEMMMSQETQLSGKSATCCKDDPNVSDDSPFENDCKKNSDITIKLKHLINSEILPLNSTDIKRNVKTTYDLGPDFTWKGIDFKHSPPYGFCMEMDKEQTEEEAEDKNWWEFWKWSVWGAIMTDQKFVTWAYFEESIINDALMAKQGTLPGSDGQSSANNFGADSQQAPMSYRDHSINASTRFDCRMTKISNPKTTTSADPSICMLPGQPFWGIDDTFFYGQNMGNQTKAEKVGDFRSMDGLRKMADFDVGREYLGIGSNGFEFTEDPKLGWLSHVCINVAFLIQCTEESTTLEELVNKVLDGINSACGNPWEFITTPLPANPLITTVVDTKALGAMVDPYPLSLQGNQTIIRTATIDTNVSNDIKAQIMYGSNAKESAGEDVPTEFSLFGMGLTDRTGPWNNQHFELQEPCEGGDTGQKEPDDPAGELKQLRESWQDAWEEITSAMTTDSISTMKSTVKALQLYSPYEDIVPTSPPMLPINLKFTMDGIHGFKWGHSLTVDPLPPRYADCTFMVTGVDHSISKDTWDTSIGTVLRMPPLPEAERVLRKELVKPMTTYQARSLGLSNKGAMA